MKVNIDFSVFLPQRSAGVVTGSLELSNVPRAGETLSLELPPVKGVEKPAFFYGQLTVENVIHPTNGNAWVLLGLQDVELENEADLFSLTLFLEQGFGFFFDSHLSG